MAAVVHVVLRPPYNVYDGRHTRCMATAEQEAIY